MDDNATLAAFDRMNDAFRVLAIEAAKLAQWFNAPETRRLLGKLQSERGVCYVTGNMRYRKHGGRLPKLDKRRKSPPLWLVLRKHNAIGI